jgi:hypothetical protein
MSTYANLYVDQGSDYQTVILAEDENGDPINLTSLTISGQVRRTYASETAYDFTITKQDETGGEIKIELDAQTTASMGRGRYVYDIYAQGSTAGSGNAFKILYGILEIIPRVTRE